MPIELMPVLLFVNVGSFCFEKSKFDGITTGRVNLLVDMSFSMKSNFPGCFGSFRVYGLYFPFESTVPFSISF